MNEQRLICGGGGGQRRRLSGGVGPGPQPADTGIRLRGGNYRSDTGAPPSRGCTAWLRSSRLPSVDAPREMAHSATTVIRFRSRPASLPAGHPRPNSWARRGGARAAPSATCAYAEAPRAVLAGSVAVVAAPCWSAPARGSPEALLPRSIPARVAVNPCAAARSFLAKGGPTTRSCGAPGRGTQRVTPLAFLRAVMLPTNEVPPISGTARGTADVRASVVRVTADVAGQVRNQALNPAGPDDLPVFTAYPM
jgi:hypothetical protein